MSFQVVQSFSDVVSFTNITGIGTAAVQVFNGSAGRLVTDTIQYACITNTHGSNLLYVGWANTVTNAIFWRVLSPGQFVEWNGNGRMDKLLSSVFVYGSAAATTMTLTTLV